MNQIITEDMIVNEETKLKNAVAKLNDNINEFIQNCSAITPILETLKIAYNSKGGEEFIKKLANMEFDYSGLSTILENADSIMCIHPSYIKTISEKITYK